MRRALAATALLLGGCYDAVAPLGVPCGPNGECPTGQQCDALSNTCLLPTELKTWRDDTAADFSTSGAVLTDTVIEKAGFVGPTAYATGRVKLTGIAGDTIGADPSVATWATVDPQSLPPSGMGFSPSLVIDYGADPPHGLGLSSGDNVTVLVEGEIKLDAAGLWRFELAANDVGFFELAPPGGDFARVVNSTRMPITASYTAPAPGWYRFRAAFADAMMNMTFSLLMDAPGPSGGLQDVRSDHLRVRVDDLDGAMFDGFNDTYDIRYGGSTLLATTLQLSLPADPFGIPLGLLSLSMRAAGEFLIDKEGDYGFTVSSHHGHRVWIDGQQVANAFTSQDATTNVPPIHLVAGWHDLVFDATKTTSSSPLLASIVVASGPDLVGQSFPVDHLRPVLGNVARWAGQSDTPGATITDAASITLTFDVELPTNATVQRVDSNFSFTHALQAQVGIVLDPPAGSNITYVAPTSLTGSGTYSDHNVVPTADAGTTWNLIASDAVADAMTGTLDVWGVTMIYDGGDKPFPTTYRYESAPKDLGNVVAIGALSWQTRQGSASKVQFRTCTDATCAGEPWTDVAPSGAVPAVALKPFAQYAVEFTSDGVTPTALDWIELKYSTR